MVLGLLLACTASETEDTAAIALCAAAPADVTWDSSAHRFMVTYCTSCHSVNQTEHRYGAPEDVNFDTEQEVYDQAARVRARVLDEGTMPIGGGVYEDDLYLLDVYLTCELGQ